MVQVLERKVCVYTICPRTLEGVGRQSLCSQVLLSTTSDVGNVTQGPRVVDHQVLPISGVWGQLDTAAEASLQIRSWWAGVNHECGVGLPVGTSSLTYLGVVGAGW